MTFFFLMFSFKGLPEIDPILGIPIHKKKEL